MVLLRSTDDLTSSYLKTFASSMTAIWKAEEFIDVTLEVEDEKFPAHRLVLSGASGYFHAMFKNGMKESKTEMVRLHGLNPAAMKVVLHYMYTGELLMEDSIESYISVLSAAHMLQLESLYNFCFEFLLKEEKLTDCFADLLYYAELYEDTKKLELIQGFVKKNFSSIVSTSQFLQFDKKHLKSLICEPHLNECMDAVVQGILRWVENDIANHTGDLFELLSLLDLKSMSGGCLETLHKHSLIKNDPTILSLLLDAATRIIKDLKMTSLTIVCFGKGDKGKSHALVYVHDIRKWVHNVLPFNLTDSTALASYNKSVYLLGGGKVEEFSNTVMSYSVEHNTTEFKANLLISKYNMGRAVFENKLYVIGGLTSTRQPLNTVECYDENTNMWVSVAPTNKPHNFPQVTQSADALFIVSSGNSSVVERYDKKTKQWAELEPLPITAEFYWPRVTTFQGKVCALYDKNVFYTYNHIRDRWDKFTLDEEITLHGIWNNSECSLSFLVAVDSRNRFYKFSPTEKYCAKICEQTGNFTWNWWQTVVFCV